MNRREVCRLSPLTTNVSHRNSLIYENEFTFNDDETPLCPDEIDQELKSDYENARVIVQIKTIRKSELELKKQN